MRPTISYQLKQAQIADLYREALRDIPACPAIHYDPARARIAEVHQQARREALAHVARRVRRWARGDLDDGAAPICRPGGAIGCLPFPAAMDQALASGDHGDGWPTPPTPTGARGAR